MSPLTSRQKVNTLTVLINGTAITHRKGNTLIMTTKVKTSTEKNWVLKHKETGKVYPKLTYASRSDARQAAKVRSLKGMYMPAQLGGGGMDPKKLKKPAKPAPKKATIKSEPSKSNFNAFDKVMDWLFTQEAAAEVKVTSITYTQ